jgi:hypothetical protein
MVKHNYTQIFRDFPRSLQKLPLPRIPIPNLSPYHLAKLTLQREITDETNIETEQIRLPASVLFYTVYVCPYSALK